MKICSKCKIEKELEDFHKEKGKPDGLSSRCNDCKRQYYAEYYENNKEKIKRNSLDYWNSNRARIIDRITIYRDNNRSKINEQCKKYRENNKEKAEAAKRKCMKKRREKLHNSYIRKLLIQQGFPEYIINENALEIKRLLVNTHREIKKHENKD